MDVFLFEADYLSTSLVAAVDTIMRRYFAPFNV